MRNQQMLVGFVIGIFVGFACWYVYSQQQQDNVEYKVAFYGRDIIDVFEVPLFTGKDKQFQQAHSCLGTGNRLNDLVLWVNDKPLAGRVFCGSILKIQSVNY